VSVALIDIANCLDQPSKYCLEVRTVFFELFADDVLELVAAENTFEPRERLNEVHVKVAHHILVAHRSADPNLLNNKETLRVMEFHRYFTQMLTQQRQFILKDLIQKKLGFEFQFALNAHLRVTSERSRYISGLFCEILVVESVDVGSYVAGKWPAHLTIL